MADDGLVSPKLCALQGLNKIVEGKIKAKIQLNKFLRDMI